MKNNFRENLACPERSRGRGSVSSGNFTKQQFTLGVSIGDKAYSVFVLPNGAGSTVSVSVIQAK